MAEPTATTPAAGTDTSAAVDDGYTDSTATATPDAEAPADTTEQATEDKQPAADSEEESSAEDNEEQKESTNSENARRRVAEREQKQQQDKQTEAVQPASEPSNDTASEPTDPNQFLTELEQGLAEEIGNIEDDTEKRQQTIEARLYMTEARAATNQLLLDHQQVSNEIPMFNPDSKQFNDQAYNYFLNEFDKAHTTKDANGVIFPKTSLLNYMRDASDLMTSISNAGALQGQRAEAKMRSKSETPGGTHEKVATEDDGFGDLPPSR